MRPPEEVAKRFSDTNDPMGWAREVLMLGMTHEALKPHLADPNDPWTPPTEAEIREEAIEYVKFAFDKALGHRGISANRSVTKLREYLWLLELPMERFNAADYPMYGVPYLFEAAKVLGVEIP